jgi:two-component system, cell cycle sensor histidine kinase and response regulator CckA
MSAERHLENLRVLLVDDDDDCREFLALALEQQGIKVTQTRDAELGIEALKKDKYDCVTTDKNLPGMDGVSFIGYIRKHYGELPVILITGQGSVGSAVDAFKLGAQDYLCKPLEDGEDLIEAVWRAVDHYRLTLQHKFLQEKLVRAQRMESLGVLAGGVAHDLNNILCPVLALPPLIKKQLEQFRTTGDKAKEEMITEEIRQIEEACERVVAVVQDMMTASVGGKFESTSQNINDVIREFMKSAELIDMRLSRPDISIEPKLAPDLAHVHGSNVHLARIISNLMRNGFEAIDNRKNDASMRPPSSGRHVLTIRTSNVHIAVPLMGYEVVNPGDYVLLEIGDTGTGINSANIQRIFEPFFTTKQISSTTGNGLGLSIIHGIVKDHNGFIDIETEVGKGTTVKVYLPAVEAAMIEAEAEAEAPVRGGSEHILVVDDDPGTRFVARRLLTMLGYTVTEVRSGQEAIALVEEVQKTGKKKPFDLAMLDMMVDESCDGLETYKRISEMCPGQKAILVSGFAATERAVELMNLGVGCLPKPYSLKDLSAALRQELDKE